VHVGCLCRRTKRVMTRVPAALGGLVVQREVREMRHVRAEAVRAQVVDVLAVCVAREPVLVRLLHLRERSANVGSLCSTQGSWSWSASSSRSVLS
jgi:hypothetical protein